MGLRVRTPLGRAAALGGALLLASGLAVAATQVAGAAPQPTVASVKANINTLTGQFNKANQQYDQVEQQLTAAKARQKQVAAQLTRDQKQYLAARKLVVQIADASYEDSSSSSLAGLLTSNDPSQVLSEASLVMQIAGTRNMQTAAFLTAANALAATQQEATRTEAGIAQLLGQKSTTKNHIATLLSKQKSILGSLTVTERGAVNQGTVYSGGTTSAVYTGTTATQAGKALAFAFAQLGCPYVYGGTGPCSAGFDCSGLAMESWAAAGVSIPRDTYEQWAALPHVSSSDLQPGDLLFYDGIGHVAIFVGGGMIIDAPTPGEPLRELPMSTSWYADNFDGAARP